MGAEKWCLPVAHSIQCYCSWTQEKLAKRVNLYENCKIKVGKVSLEGSWPTLASWVFNIGRFRNEGMLIDVRVLYRFTALQLSIQDEDLRGAMNEAAQHCIIPQPAAPVFAAVLTAIPSGSSAISPRAQLLTHLTVVILARGLAT